MENIVHRDALDEYTQKVSAKYKNMFAPKSAVGAPLSASTAAEMTDTTKIYVYTGSESGYTAGNWYYYDGSTWISGGVYNSTAFEADTTLSISGAAADAKAVGDAIDLLQNKGLTYLGTFLNNETWDTVTTDGTKSFDGLPNNIFAVCNVTETTNPIQSSPVSGSMVGTILTFGRNDKDYRRDFDTQIFIPHALDKIFIRKYRNSAWGSWNAVGGTYLESQMSTLPQFRAGVNDEYVSYNYLVSNVTDDGTFFVSQTDTSGGAIVQRWTDLPTLDQNFIIKNSRYSTNSILQTAIPTDTLNPVYSRIIARPGITYAVKPWSTYSGIDPRKKILAVGDSICAGWRNSGKGFVGDLGLPYQNKGLSGTTMSNYLDGTIGGEDKTCIPQQIARVTGYQPDIIIANGGHNDYNYSVPMGDIPAQPATDINTLDAGTVMGGLQRLFLIMINNYPTAERYFVTTHKINRTAQNEPEKNGYLPTKINTAGYTETDLHDAIVQCCNVYNVKVIDIFNDSPINSLYSVYRGQYYYGSGADNPSGTSAETDLTNYFDKDGVHPLSRGYLEGYVPLILAALKGNTSGAISRAYLSHNEIDEVLTG